ncbi:EpsG family protein [Vibrio breoganii]
MINSLIFSIYIVSVLIWLQNRLFGNAEKHTIGFICVLIVYFFFAIIIGMREVYVGSDTIIYSEFFKYINITDYYGLKQRYSFELGNIGLAMSINVISDKVSVYLVIYSLLISLIYLYASHKIFDSQYSALLILVILAFPFYYSMTGNVIRTGLALSIGILSIVLYYRGKVLYSLFCSFLALLFHASLISFVVVFLTKKISVTKVLLIWLSSIVVGNFLTHVDFGQANYITQKLMAYQSAADYTDYKTGFRLDFFLFSLIPLILYTYSLIRKFNISDLYIYLLKIYLMLNVIYNLSIHMAFSDRFALLSWVLIPILVVESLRYMDSKVTDALVLLFVPISFYYFSNNYLLVF